MKLFCEIAIIIISACLIASCNSGKNIAKEATIPAKASIPCSESGISDNVFFRASANATSSSISLAREKAIAAAKSELGKAIIANTLSTAEKYASETGVSDRTNFSKRIELITNQVVDQTISGISIICENYSESNSRYTTYIAVEIEKQTVIDKICELTIKQINDFNEEKFKMLFNK